MKLNRDQLDRIIENTLQEDLGTQGDLTTHFSVSENIIGKAHLIAREPMIVAGLPIAERVFQRVDSGLVFDGHVQEGQPVPESGVIAEIFGDLRSILTAERTALNFLQRLSGIATLTRSYVDRIASTNTIILDTRKTTPQLRALEKYAVRMGGGQNHRFGLYDMILIKDNHIDAAGGIEEAITRCRTSLDQMRLQIPVEIEVQTLEQLKEVLCHPHPVQQIMLDNMTIEEIREAVTLIGGKIKVEASGNITLDTVRDIAATGVDYISVGALTHSVKAADISLRLFQQSADA